MVDVNISVNTGQQKKLKDMGDGTHAEVVVVAGMPALPTDRSGTIAIGGTSQQLMAANPARRGLWVQNQSNGDLFINGAGVATIGQPSMRIPAGALYESPAHGVNGGAINIVGATAGQAFAAREW